MAQEDRKRRYTEVWVNCAATETAYGRLSTQPRDFKNLTETLSRSLLGRIRGREKKDVVRQTTLIQTENVKKFAQLCNVPTEALLANGDGLTPLKALLAPKEQLAEASRNKHAIERVFSEGSYVRVYSNGIIVQSWEITILPHTDSLFVVYPTALPTEFISIDLAGINASKQEITLCNCRLVFLSASVERKIQLTLSGM